VLLILSTCNNNFRNGIALYTNCDNNIITGNIVSNTGAGGAQDVGIHLHTDCDDNTLTNNTTNDNTQHGIYLEDFCDGNTLTNNTANDNSQYGIFLYNGCYNNIFMGNTVNDNDYGIHLGYDSDFNTFTLNLIFNNNLGIAIFHTGCYSNLFYENIISYNDINAHDHGTNDNWDNGIFGNYWSNYTGSDVMGDGIGDVPQDIQGVGNAKDNYPLMNFNPMFLKLPKNITYEIGTTGHELKWTVLDFSPQLQSYEVYRNGESIEIYYFPSLTFDSEILVNVDGLAAGLYKYTLKLYHGPGNPVLDEVWVTVSNMEPTFSSTPNDISVEEGSTGNFISWIFTDIDTNNATYTILRDGVEIIIDAVCSPNTSIDISLDGLEPGTYIFQIKIDDGYGSVISDIVEATITSSSAVPSSPTDSEAEAAMLIMIGTIIGGSILGATILAHGLLTKNRPLASPKLPSKREIKPKNMKKSPELMKRKDVKGSDRKNLEK
jgi:parallel beta-helix repeat protein